LRLELSLHGYRILHTSFHLSTLVKVEGIEICKIPDC
jgi:hypothetical protein